MLLLTTGIRVMALKKGHALRTGLEEYRIIRQRGAGGSGEVYEALDSGAGPCAIKVLDVAKTKRALLQRFKNEIAFCSRHNCRYIVPVRDYGVSATGATFYVMPLYEATLRELIAKGIPPETVLPYFSNVLEAVQYAHLKGVWHRDLKPANILFSTVNNCLIVGDFGIAHFEEEELLTAVETKSQERLANFEYAAPEQRRCGPVDGKADVYALGLILNEMFTPNFGYLDDLVDLMRRQDPASRPSIEQVQRELEARGNSFVVVQRLNAAKPEVIPESEIDDPFVKNPIRILNADYQNGWVIYKLSGTPPPHWIQAFRNPQFSYSGYYLRGPQSFNINGDTAQVQLDAGETIEQTSIYAKQYVDLANKSYAFLVNEQHRKNLEARRQAQRKAIEEAERRKQMLEKIAKIEF